MDRHALVTDRLRPDEQLLWVGGSDPAKTFGFNDRYLVPFSVLFCALVTVALASAASAGAHLAALVPLSILELVSLHLLVGRFLVKRHRKRSEVYAVTDRRALVVTRRSTRDTDVRRTDRSVDWSGRHVSISWDDSSHLDSLFWRGSTSVRQYANTGLNGVFGGPRDFAFHDVADGEALLDALASAKDHGAVDGTP